MHKITYLIHIYQYDYADTLLKLLTKKKSQINRSGSFVD